MNHYTSAISFKKNFEHYFVRLGWSEAGAQGTEVANLDLTLGVEENVRRLDVSVQHLPRMHELQRLQELVDDVLLMDLFENVRTNHGVQVRFHIIGDQINVLARN